MKLYVKNTQTFIITEGLDIPTPAVRPDKGTVLWLSRGIINHNDDPGICNDFTNAITPANQPVANFPLPISPQTRGISAFSGSNLVPVRLLNSTVRGQIGLRMSYGVDGNDNNVNQAYWYSGKADEPGPQLQPSIILQRGNNESFSFPATSSFLSNSGLHLAPNYLLSDDQVIYDQQTSSYLLTRDWQLLAPNGLSGPVNVNVIHPLLTSSFPPVLNKPATISQMLTIAKLTSIFELEITDRALESGGGNTTPVGLGLSIPGVEITANLTDNGEMRYSAVGAGPGFALLVRLNDLVGKREALGIMGAIWNPTEPTVIDSTLQVRFEVSASPLLF